jgi:hypothetical protein
MASDKHKWLPDDASVLPRTSDFVPAESRPRDSGIDPLLDYYRSIVSSSVKLRSLCEALSDRPRWFQQFIDKLYSAPTDEAFHAVYVQAILSGENRKRAAQYEDIKQELEPLDQELRKPKSLFLMAGIQKENPEDLKKLKKRDNLKKALEENFDIEAELKDILHRRKT